MADNIRVAVRLRPLNNRELKASSNVVVRMDGASTWLHGPEPGQKRQFTFDYSFDSTESDSESYASQGCLWDAVGEGLLKSAFAGYNTSLFAYGQTGSGKSYAMMGGPGVHAGFIPRACARIFEAAQEACGKADGTLQVKVEASMLEIHMEKIKDLLEPRAAAELKVRLHPKTGFYVDGLSWVHCSSAADLERLLALGAWARTIGATQMNTTSSRAHTIFAIRLTQTQVDHAAGTARDTHSLVNLVDLAGSERQAATGAEGQRFKESCAINTSLSALGNVISALAALADGKGTTTKRAAHVPYRDSVLTQLLENSLGGNARTCMLATISPAEGSLDETLSTLRYADRAKRIRNKPVVNVDPQARLIAGLKAEIEELKAALARAQALAGGGGRDRLDGVGACAADALAAAAASEAAAHDAAAAATDAAALSERRASEAVQKAADAEAAERRAAADAEARAEERAAAVVAAAERRSAEQVARLRAEAQANQEAMKRELRTALDREVGTSKSLAAQLAEAAARAAAKDQALVDMEGVLSSAERATTALVERSEAMSRRALQQQVLLLQQEKVTLTRAARRHAGSGGGGGGGGMGITLFIGGQPSYGGLPSMPPQQGVPQQQPYVHMHINTAGQQTQGAPPPGWPHGQQAGAGGAHPAFGGYVVTPTAHAVLSTPGPPAPGAPPSLPSTTARARPATANPGGSSGSDSATLRPLLNLPPLPSCRPGFDVTPARCGTCTTAAAGRVGVGTTMQHGGSAARRPQSSAHTAPARALSSSVPARAYGDDGSPAKVQGERLATRPSVEDTGAANSVCCVLM